MKRRAPPPCRASTARARGRRHQVAVGVADRLGEREQQQREQREREAEQAILHDVDPQPRQHLEEEVGREREHDEQQSILRHARDHAVDRRRLDQIDRDGRPFHSAGSMIARGPVMRGEPNSVVCQFASKPSAETVESSGSVLPPKLGDGQDDGTTAASSLPANWTANDAGAAQADGGLELHARAAGQAPARAAHSPAPVRHLCRRSSGRKASGQGTHAGRRAVDRDVVGRAAAPGEPRLFVTECDRRFGPDEASVLVGHELAQPCFGRHNECALHVERCVVDRRTRTGRAAAPAG